MDPSTISAAMPRRLLLAMLLLVVPFHPGQAQFSQLKQAVEGAAPAQAPSPDKPEEARKRLEQWHKEAREMLGRLDGSAGNVVVPDGITPAEINERRRDLEQLVLITTTSLKEFSAVEQATNALERARAEDAAWTGFKETLPFSILLLDDLLSERSAVLAKRRTTESALANMEGLRAKAMDELKAAEDRSNSAIAAVQNAEESKADAAKWRLDAARAKVRTQAARAGYLQTAIEAHKQRVTAVNIELALVDRKIAVVRPEVVFSDEDLAKVEGIANERSKALQKEIAAVSKRLQTAFSARIKAQTALDAILAKPAEERDPDALDLARFRMEAVEGRVESLQSVNQSLEGLSMMENFVVQAYQDRRTIMQTDDDAERGKLLESLGIMAERYRSWLNVINNEIGTCGAELSKIESRAASISPDDPRFELINEQRAARSEKLTMLQRVQQAATSQRTILRRWISEHTPEPEETGLVQKLGDYAANGWDMVKKTWDFQVMSFEDKIEVDGIIGTVVEVNTRSSIIRSADEVETMIPNSLFLENRVTNWTLSSSKMRRNVRVGVAYGTDPRVVMNILTECASRHGLICKDPEPFAISEDFGDSALVFTLYFWIELVRGTNAIIVASDLRLMIEKRLGEAGIGVPFPQRDIHLISKQPINVRMTNE